MPNTLGEVGGDLLLQDEHVVVVVHLENLGHQPGADAIRLAEVIVHRYLHDQIIGRDEAGWKKN